MKITEVTEGNEVMEKGHPKDRATDRQTDRQTDREKKEDSLGTTSERTNQQRVCVVGRNCSFQWICSASAEPKKFWTSPVMGP